MYARLRAHRSDGLVHLEFAAREFRGKVFLGARDERGSIDVFYDLHVAALLPLVDELPLVVLDALAIRSANLADGFPKRVLLLRAELLPGGVGDDRELESGLVGGKAHVAL